MDSVLSRLLAHEQNRTQQNIDQLKSAMDTWVTKDPKEIASRNVDQIINRITNEIINEFFYFQQKCVATEVTHHLLNTRSRHVVNDADTTEANKPALKSSMFAQLQMTLRPDAGAAAMKADLGIRSSAHWEKKGLAVATSPAMDIRCAESAALVIHTLRQRPGFNLPLAVIEQGRGSIDGHFWVIAGNVTTPTGSPDFGPDTFAIDLWGHATRHVNHVVIGPPGHRPFNMSNNSIKILVSWP